MKKNLLGILFLFWVCMAWAGELKLWYSKPAKDWTEALPVGNSRLGAMVYGGTGREELQLNEETFWAGGPYDNNNTNALYVLPVVRNLIFQGKTREAQRLVDANFLARKDGMSYLTMGSLFLDFPGHEEATDFYRDLNIEDATATTRYKVDGVTYTRRVFASFTDSVIVVRLQADKAGALAFTVGYDAPLKHEVNVEGDLLTITCEGKDQEGVKAALRAECRVKVVSDGQTITEGKNLKVTGATEATLYLSAATNYVNYHDVSGDAAVRADRCLQRAVQIPYKKALENHVAYYRKLFGRVQLDLGETAAASKETTLRIRDFCQGTDPSLATLLFQYGRYLLISSSQPGGQPANLQGILNRSTTAPWDSKYTININTEMNYWLAEVANLSEMHQPLFSMLEDLSVTGAKTAREMYGCGGWVAHHNTDLWRICGVVDFAAAGMWPSGGAWLAQHLWQHYLFTADKDFLKAYYPVLKGTARFFLDFLVEHPSYKWWVVAPSVSPEHGPVTAGCTMDNQIVFDALRNTLLASEIVGDDAAFRDSLAQMLDKLPPMQVGRHGQLQEWLQDVDDPKDEHRHISHLYGLYPSNQVSPFLHPELFRAARTTLEQRGDKANTEDEVFHACEEAVQEIVDLIHRISVSGNTYHFIVTADHGFIYKRDKLTESDKISGKSADKAFVNRRFIVSKATLEDDGIDHMSMGRILGNEDSKMVSYPVSSNVFKVAGGGANYVHGGSSPQEMLVPVLEFKMERGHMETKNAEIALVSIVHKITNLITSMDFIQSDAVSDTVKAAKYRIFFLSEDNEKITNENSYVADNREENAQQRIFQLWFTFKMSLIQI